MKTYVITLERSKERGEYIKKHLKEHGLEHQIIHAVDGSLLSPDEIAMSCDMEAVNRLDWWLTKGAIGCALSHYKAYETFLESV